MGEDDQFKVKISRKCQINQSVQLAHVSALQISDSTNKIVAISIDNDFKDYNISNFGHIIPSKMLRIS